MMAKKAKGGIMAQPPLDPLGMWRDMLNQWEHANLWGSLRRCCGCLVVVREAEAGIAPAECIFERVVQHRGAHIKEGLHRGPVPAHLLFLVHALGHDLVDRTLHECG